MSAPLTSRMEIDMRLYIATDSFMHGALNVNRHEKLWLDRSTGEDLRKVGLVRDPSLDESEAPRGIVGGTENGMAFGPKEQPGNAPGAGEAPQSSSSPPAPASMMEIAKRSAAGAKAAKRSAK